MTGSGTLTNPFVIYDVNDLQAVSGAVTAYYELANNIDASTTSGWNSGQGFVPIDAFSGDFDGNSYTISGLYMNRVKTGATSSFGVGLFGSISGGKVRMLKIYDAYISGSLTGFGSQTHMSTGILAGWLNTSSQVEYVFTSGTVSSSADVEKEYTARPQNHAGGITGLISDTSKISKCCSTANIYVYSTHDSWAHAGGLVGRMYDGGNIYDSYARGNAYAEGGVDSQNVCAGGLVGERSGAGGYIKNCYSTGKPSGNKAGGSPLLGGLTGWEDGDWTCDYSFWDVNTSEQYSSTDGTGKTTSQMKTITTFTDVGWDFVTIWGIVTGLNDGYPTFIFLVTTYESYNAITAVHMDTSRTIVNYPDSAIAYFGTLSGELYKSTDGLQSWHLIHTFPSKIVEVMSSDINYNDVVVGELHGIWVSNDGGTNWGQKLSVPSVNVKGLFLRNNEVQVVAGNHPSSAVGKRSPNLGNTWYNLNGLPTTVQDVVFNGADPRNSFVGCSGALYKYSSGSSDYTYVSGAAITGQTTRMDVDLNSSVALIGTDQKVYKTVDWGNTAYVWLNAPAPGGVAIAGISPTVSGI